MNAMTDPTEAELQSIVVATEAEVDFWNTAEKDVTMVDIEKQLPPAAPHVTEEDWSVAVKRPTDAVKEMNPALPTIVEDVI